MARDDNSHRHAGSRYDARDRRRDDDRNARERDDGRYARNDRYGSRREYDRREYDRRDRYRDDDRSRRPRSPSRDRRRSRSPVRDSRRRSRERDQRRRDDGRERASSRDRNRGYRTRDSSMTRSSRVGSPSRPSTPANAAQPPLDPVAAKQAKIEAWRAKQLAQREARAKEEAASNPVKESEVSKSKSATPAAASPPDTAEADGVSSPRPGPRFDPKAVIKKATHAATNKGALGLDVSSSAIAQKSATKPTFQAPRLANDHKAAKAQSPKASNGSKPAGKFSGFGLAGSAANDSVSRVGVVLEDELKDKRTIEKLQFPTSEDQDEDHLHANGEEDDEDIELEDAQTDEAKHEAAMQALEARRLEVEALLFKDDVEMKDAPSNNMADAAEGEDEEMDELDKYMAGIEQQARSLETQTPDMFGARQAGPRLLEAEDEIPFENDLKAGEDDDFLAKAQRKKAKRELKKIDHKSIDYEDFTRNFYTESDDTKQLTEDEVSKLRFELEQISVRGKDVPKPVDRWTAMGLSTQIQQIITSLKYTQPTPIQAQAIPVIMSGRDLIGVAKTGSGKTMAFLLPMFRHIKAQRPLRKTKIGSEGPIAIVIAPTRELATQIGGECKHFAKALGLHVTICFGQSNLKDNIDRIKNGTEIIVGTPGRLIELAGTNHGNLLSFRRVTYVVLDEADRLWDMGFTPQMKMILSQIRPDRQFVMFSATFPNNLENFAKEMLKNRPVQITIGGRAKVAPEITLEVELLERPNRLKRLLQILGETYQDAEWTTTELWDFQTLIFLSRQDAATELLGALLKRGFKKVSYIHGGREQDERAAAIEDFKNGHYPILIATSVAARGLDVKNLKLVINYDVPSHLEDFVHRAGRTGRAGNTGTCITFITKEDAAYAADVVKALKYSDREVPEDIEGLANDYKKRIKKGEAQPTSKGFGGHGVEKFDHARIVERAVLKKEAGLEDPKPVSYNPDDEEAGFSMPKAEATDEASKPSGALAKAPAEPVAKEEAEPAEPLGSYAGLDEYNIKVHRRVVEPAPELPTDPLARARAVAAQIAERRNGVAAPPGGAVSAGHNRDNKGPDAGAFHATLEINDFPQKARWGVTNRTNVKSILDQHGVSITSKGIFYKPGDAPKSETDPPKLYLLVEGDTESTVMGAVRDLVRLVKEGIVQDMEAATRQPRAPGKYSLI